ncbi:MAG: hypothetical protein DHS80DRAFT_30758 [Piptocephalis tieghemiana]|nr:MAG: hypothetical protein DHS80DRAFT_30758 [Piptocephalis tieghemiana]
MSNTMKSILTLLFALALVSHADAGVNDDKAKEASALYRTKAFSSFTLIGPAKVLPADSYGSNPGPQSRNVQETLSKEYYLDRINDFYYMPSSDLYVAERAEGVLVNAKTGDIKANSPLVAGYANVPNSQDPVTFQFNYIKINTKIPHMPTDALYAFQLKTPDGKCLASNALSRRFMSVLSNPEKRECESKFSENQEITISSTLEASDNMDYLGTLWISTQDSKGDVHINNVRDLIKGYWSCLNEYGEVAKCSEDDGMKWKRR